MSKSTWTGAVNSDWADADNWSPAGVPDASSDVTIATGDAVASASIGTVNSITDSSDLSFESAGTNTVATTLDNTGHLRVDARTHQFDKARAIERRRRHLVRSREGAVADEQTTAVVQRPGQDQARSAVAADEVETDGSIVDERPVVDTAALLWSPKIAPAPIEASPVRALFDPGAALSSIKASFPFRCNCA